MTDTQSTSTHRYRGEIVDMQQLDTLLRNLGTAYYFDDNTYKRETEGKIRALFSGAIAYRGEIMMMPEDRFKLLNEELEALVLALRDSYVKDDIEARVQARNAIRAIWKIRSSFQTTPEER